MRRTLAAIAILGAPLASSRAAAIRSGRLDVEPLTSSPGHSRRRWPRSYANARTLASTRVWPASRSARRSFRVGRARPSSAQPPSNPRAPAAPASRAAVRARSIPRAIALRPMQSWAGLRRNSERRGEGRRGRRRRRDDRGRFYRLGRAPSGTEGDPESERREREETSDVIGDAVLTRRCSRVDPKRGRRRAPRCVGDRMSAPRGASRARPAPPVGGGPPPTPASRSVATKG